MNNYNQQAKKIISENIYMVIASASAEAKPWITPVFFAYDDQYNLFWVSHKDSRHSTLIRSNPQVAVVIFDSKVPEGKADAVYVEATADELTNEAEIKYATDVLSARVTKDEFKVKRIEDVTNEGLWRVYKAVPQKVYKLAEGKYINGQYVDTRTEVDLK